jgi:RimJ/RimL family protein N-acetyltransferase
MSNSTVLSPSVRLAHGDDVPALAALKLACFRETFGAEGFGIPYPPADLARFEAESYGPGRIAAELADPAHTTWVAQAGEGDLVAYAHIGPAHLPHAGVGADDQELYQLYLRKSVQGQGLGKQMMALAMAAMAGKGQAVWLGVWSGNVRAQHVYAAQGFVPVGEYQFAVGDWRDDEIIMARRHDGQAL